MPKWRPGIPLLPSPLIGRRDEVRAACRAILEDGVRLLTVAGPPGVGKTSLALAVAHDLAERFRHGVSFVDLAPIGDAAQVGSAIVAALGVGTTPGRRPIDRLTRAIGDRERLLVLDNFEQVIAAAPLLADLLAVCPALAVIVTSREPLRLRWEQELPLAPFPVPELIGSAVLDVLRASPAVRLFAERARAVAPGFAVGPANAETVAEICRRLDGLPLAIELAAARVRHFAPSTLLERLAAGHQQRLDPTAARPSPPIPAGGPRDLPLRQRSVHDAIAWSYRLLDAEEQALFRRLAVFSGGCTFEAAEAVCDASWESVAALIEKSLLRHDVPADGEPRLRMLETIYEYALRRLEESDEHEAIRTCHLAYYVDLAEQAEPRLTGPGQAAWLDRLDRERANLNAAARWATAQGDGMQVLRLGSALWRFWWIRGDAVEARERLAGVLALARAQSACQPCVKAFHGAGVLAQQLGEYATARALYEESRALARRLDDRRGIALATRQLGRLAYYRGDYAEGRARCEESLAIFQALGDGPGICDALRDVGFVSQLEGDLPRARSHLEQALEIARDLADPRRIGDVAFALGMTYHVSGDLGIARRLYEESLARDRALGHRASAGSALSNIANVATLEGDLPTARALLRESLLASRDAGDRRRLAFTLSVVAGLAAAEGEPERAVRLDTAAIAATTAMGARLAPGMRAVYDRQLGPARAALGADGLAAATAGRGLSLEQAVDEALAWLGRDGDPGTLDTRPVDAPGGEPGPEMPMAEARQGDQPGSSTRPTQDEHQTPRQPGAEVLTRRELDVAILIGRGLSNREIAEALVITVGTAQSYVHRVLTRLDFTRRAQVAAWAVARGLHELEIGR